MKEFKRIFKYVWPQWPRVIIVVVSAVVVAMLLSLSFMAFIPILKVMMGEEGLHGWVDRNTCEWRYGVSFSVPSITDLTSDTDIGSYLLVTGVEKATLGEAAEIKASDRIVGAGDLRVTERIEKISYADLLEELATTTEENITVQIRRLNSENVLEEVEVVLATPYNEARIKGVERNATGQIKWGLEGRIMNTAQWVVSLLPRDRAKVSRVRAVIFIIIVLFVVTAIRCVAKFYQTYMAQKVVQVGINRLREDAFSHVLDMPVGYFSNERPSDTVSRLIHDTSIMGKAIKIMLGKALREPLNALFFMAGAMLISWQLTLIFMCAAPLTLWLVAMFGRRMRKASRKSLMASSQMLAKLHETLAGLKIVKVYNRQAHERNAFHNINQKLLKQLLKISRVDAMTTPVLEVLGMAAGSTALIVGVYWVNQDKIDSSEFLVLLGLMGVAAEAVRKTSDIWNKIQEANAASDRVFSVLDQPVEITNPVGRELPALKDRIEFRDVVFTYPNGVEPVLKGVNLRIQSGHNVAIVGPNGSGKTTLVNLIPRFYNVDSGAILIDGYDISEVSLASLRSQIAMVTQNVVTFNDTIAANIAYGEDDASMEEIIAAAKRAYAHEFIEPLPEGYETIIGEQGVGLSGGQLQRIVIARAILKNPAILIFDEATSQVDAQSEAKIHKAIEAVMAERTSILIAHRFSTVVNADVIVVMDRGRIVAEGTHDELIKSCGLYQNLYETQLVKS